MEKKKKKNILLISCVLIYYFQFEPEMDLVIRQPLQSMILVWRSDSKFQISDLLKSQCMLSNGLDRQTVVAAEIIDSCESRYVSWPTRLNKISLQLHIWYNFWCMSATLAKKYKLMCPKKSKIRSLQGSESSILYAPVKERG